MKCLRIYTDADGTSHFADAEWRLREGDFTPPSPSGYSITDQLRPKALLMMHHPAGYRDEWHCAPAPVLGTVLRGRVRISVSDGDARILGPGDQFLAVDLAGAGHRMDEVDGGAYDLALVVLDDGPDAIPTDWK